MSSKKPLDIQFLFSQGSQAFENFVPWLVDSINEAYSQSDWLKALTQLGGSPHPGHISKTDMPPSMRNNLSRLERELPLVHNALASVSPAYASLVVRAKFDEAIDNQPGEGKTSMPVRDAIREVYGPSGVSAFDSGMQFADIITGVPAHAAGQLDHLFKDVVPLVTKLGELIELLRKFYDLVEKIEPDIEKWFSYAVKDVLPALDKLNDVVMKPYLEACANSKEFMDKLSKQMAEARTSVDSAVPAIIGNDNIDAEELQALSTALNLPIIGVIYSSQLNALLLLRYGAQQHRGFIDEIAKMQAAKQFPSAVLPLSSLLGAVDDTVTRPPIWFMRN